MENRYINIAYLAGFAIFSLIFAKTASLIWEVAELPAVDIIPNQLGLPIVIGVLLGLILTVVLYKNNAAHSYVAEVVSELEQTDWPSMKETQKSTLIVVGFALILGAYLFVIDKIWSLLTNFILVS